MKLIVSETCFFSQLEAYLEEKACKLHLVQAEYQRPGKNDGLSDFKGIDAALELSEDITIIICSFMPESYFIQHKELSTKFFALMARGNVGFIDTLSRFGKFYEKYLELVNSEKEEDVLALELEKERRENEVLGKLNHSIGHLMGKAHDHHLKIAQAINDARQAGFSGSDAEILKRIGNFKRESLNNRLAGKYFPGVFCDLEGTLLINGQLNVGLLDELKRLALIKPITLWTAGNLTEFQDILISKGVFWKLVSKYDFAGAEVEIVFDDLSYEDFMNKFGIKVRVFNPVISHNRVKDLKLKFLHSLLIPAEIPKVLITSEFSEILDMVIGGKKIREYVEDMKELAGKEYNQDLVLLRDYILHPSAYNF